MDFLKRTITRIMTCICLLTVASVVAQEEHCDFNDSCGWSLCDLEFEIGADFLWWKPCVDDLDYAAKKTGDNPTRLKMNSIDPDWEPGVRVTLTLLDFYCDWNLCASYTYLGSDDSSTVKENAKIIPAIIHPGISISSFYNEGKGSWCSRYHEWDVLLGYDILCNEYYSLQTLVGVVGINLDQRFKATLSDESTQISTKWSSDFCGVGLRFVTDYKFRLSECLELAALTSGTILTGSADTKNVMDDSDSDKKSDFIFMDDDPCQIVCGYRIGVGLIYETALCNYDSALKIGYEFVQWHNIPNHRIFVSDNSSSSSDGAVSTSSNTRTFGFHGLTLGLAMEF